MEKGNIENCPKCGAEKNKIMLGSLAVDCCPNCRGMFVAYKNLKHPLIGNFQETSEKKRPDRHELNQLVIQCPQCNVTMEKKYGGKKKVLLDICPSCQGIWFDEGELTQFRRGHCCSKPTQMVLRLCCEPCNIVVDYAEAVREGDRSPKCPRCGQSLSFEGVGEVLLPRIAKRDIVAVVIFFISLAIFFLLALNF